MPERRFGLPIDAAGHATSGGRESLQILAGFRGCSQNSDDMFSKWGEKGIVWHVKTPDFDAHDSDFRIEEPKFLTTNPTGSVRAI